MPFPSVPIEGASASERRTTLTIVYQEEVGGGTHYASIPVASKYKDALDSACECFEEYLPENWESYTIELQHSLGEGRWAVIHPSVFSEIATSAAARSADIRLQVRPNRNQSRGNTGENHAGVIEPSSGPSVSTQGESTSNASVQQDPPAYGTIATPYTLVLETPAPAISDPNHEAFCDRCKHKIHGIRYKCTACEDFDYCSICIGFAPLEHSHHFQPIINHETRVFRPMDQWRATSDGQPASNTSVVRHEAICDICEASPIVGIRFKCAVCPDWDVCHACLERSLVAHPEHPFIKIANPTDILLRNSHPTIPIRTGLQCSRCQKEIVGSSFYECGNRNCRFNYICVNCEASPLPLACTHTLVKNRMRFMPNQVRA